MKTPRTTRSTNRYVICVNNGEYPASLELFKIYRAIPDKQAQTDGDMRVIDESCEDYLFPAEYFLPIRLPRTIVRVLNKSLMLPPATV
jgi:hypothetical protein